MNTKSSKPYWKLNKETNKWEYIKPDPNQKEFFHLRGHALSSPVGKGSK